MATREPRLAAIVAFVSTGAYEQWLETWHTNKLWSGQSNELWPETKALLEQDPIRRVSSMFPMAVPMVSGGGDKIVDPSTARAFVSAARPFYKSDPHRLPLAVYEGFQLQPAQALHRALVPNLPASEQSASLACW